MSRPLVRVARAFVLALLFSAVVATSAQAADPALQLTGGPAASVLYGNALPVSLTASLPAGSSKGYNLAFRVVLPAGVTYTPGSAGTDGNPTILHNAPTTGQTTLIWPNTDDLVPASSHTLSFSTTYDQTVYDVGDPVPFQTGAYISDDVRNEADFNPTTGVPSDPGGTSYTSSATVNASTSLTAIEVAKSEPHPEGEIPRGLHDHQTTYTLTVTNNKVNPTNGVSLEDYLPDGLEFLGCAGQDDNTTQASTNPGSAEEYPGSGPITVAHPDASEHCVAPDLVETVQLDPDGMLGPLPFGVYTHVKWNASTVGSFTANQVKTFTYAAAIPIRRNTTTWSGATPATTGAQTANLDNNNGLETTDEEQLLNGAIVKGTYQAPSKPGKAVSDEGTLLRTAEDLAIQKSNDNSGLEQGDLTKWTIDLQVSEYRYLNDVSITDVVPDGLCPLSDDPSVNYEHVPAPVNAECNGVAGKGPSKPYKSVDEQSTGKYNVVWDKTTFGDLAHLMPNDVKQLTFYTRTRHDYQEDFADSTPILSKDAVSNDISTTGSAFVRCQGGDPDCTDPPVGDGGTKIYSHWHDGDAVLDVSGSGKAASGPAILKTVADHYPASGNCNDLADNAYGKATPVYGPSDKVCWKLRLTFPTSLNTTSQDVFDYLPSGLTYIDGSAQLTSADTLHPVSDVDTSAADSGRLSWTLGTDDDVPTGGKVFEVTFATTVGSPAGHHSGDVEGNLMKFSYENTQGTAFALRDSADFALKIPELGLVKGVAAVNPAGLHSAPVYGPNSDHKPVQGGDVVQYRVDVTNTGRADADAATVWDVLPAGIDCSMIVAGSISDGGSCPTPGSRVEWTHSISVPAGASPTYTNTKTLTYEVNVPSDVSPDQTYTNTAGVVNYTYTNNTGGTYLLVPANPDSRVKDPTNPSNMPKAQDSSDIYTPGSTVVKTRTTSVDESGNAALDQATIGETVDYTVTTTIPKGTTLYGTPKVVDPLGSQQTLVAGSLCASGCSFAGTPMTAGPVGTFTAGGVSLTESPANTLTATFPATYTAPADHDVKLVMTFSAKVLDVAANTRGTSLNNTATLTFKDQANRTVTKSGSVGTTIVEPKITATKTDGLGGARVLAGQTVDYTVNAAASSGTNYSAAHEVVVVDTLPVGTDPVLTGGTVGPQHGVWNAGARTITWDKTSTPALALVTPGTTVPLTYQATVVENPATAGGVYTNTVTEKTSSLDASVGGVRTPGSPGATEPDYSSSADDTIALTLPSLTKSVTPDYVTIGNEVVWTVQVTFPKDLRYFDAAALDTVPDGFDVDSYGPISCSGCQLGDPVAAAVGPATGTVQPDGTVKTAWWIGDLPSVGVDRVYTLTLKGHLRDAYRNGGAQVKQTSPLTALTNRAWVVTNQHETVAGTPTEMPSHFDDTVGPQTAVNHVVEPRLGITKTASQTTYAQGGDHLTYTVTVTNSGGSAAYDTVVKDLPDTELTNVVLTDNAAYATKTWSAGDRNIAWTYPGPLAAGDSVTFKYTADVVASGSLHAADQVENTAKVDTYFGVPKTTRDTHGFVYRTYTGPSATIALKPDFPKLSLVKTTGAPGSPDIADAQVGQPFSWQVTVSNSSHVAVAKSVSVVDTLPPNWSYTGPTTYSTGGGANPAITVNQPAGDTLTWANVGDLAPGGSVTLTFTATPNLPSTVTPGVGDAHPHTNTAVSAAKDSTGATGNADGPYVSNSDTAQAVIHLPDLTIVKTPDNGAATAGTASSFTIKVTNDDSVATAHNVKVHDVLPSGLTYAAGTATASGGGTFTEAPGGGPQVVDWNIVTLAPHETVTITMPVFVDPSVPNNTPLTNTASTHADEVPTDKSDTGSLLVNTKADLQVTKTSPAGAVTPGTNLTYTIVTKNNGPSDAQNSQLADTLPAYLSFVSLDDPSHCTNVGQAISCSYGTLVPGASRTVHVTVAIDPARTTTITNAADVTTTTTDTNPSNNHDHADNPVTPTSDVSIVKTADKSHYNGGDTVTYTLIARNSGPSTAANVVVTDPLPGDVTFVSASPAGANCTLAGATVTCSVGSLAPGQALPIVITTKAKGQPPVAGSGTHDHQITVAKEEQYLSIQAHQTATTTLTCSNGGEMVDGSFVIESVDQGEDVHGVHIVENHSASVGSYAFKVRNDTNGQAQVKVFGLCLPARTEDTDGHTHAILVGDMIEQTSGALPVGLHTFHFDTPAGFRAVAPGISVESGDAAITRSEDDGHGGWDFTVNVTSPAVVKMSVRPLQETTGVTDGHAHDLLFSHPVVHATIGANQTQVVRVSCPVGSKGITATYDLPPGIVFRGNEPEPINRDFTLQNTTSGPLDVDLDLICLSITTGTNIDGLAPVVNTATIATSTPESSTANNSSSATITISRAQDSVDTTPSPGPSDPPAADPPAADPPAATPPGPSDAPLSVMSLRFGSSVTVAYAGDSASVPVSCTGTATCSGTVSLSAVVDAAGASRSTASRSVATAAKAKAKPKKVVLGTARYTAKAGKTVTVKVSIAKKYRTLLRTGRVRSVTVTAGKTVVSAKTVVAKKKAAKKVAKKVAKKKK